MKTTLLILTTFCSLNLFAGGVHCKSCPAESDACMPKADCKIERSDSCALNMKMGTMAFQCCHQNTSSTPECALIIQ